MAIHGARTSCERCGFGEVGLGGAVSVAGASVRGGTLGETGSEAFCLPLCPSWGERGGKFGPRWRREADTLSAINARRWNVCVGRRGGSGARSFSACTSMSIYSLSSPSPSTDVDCTALLVMC